MASRGRGVRPCLSFPLARRRGSRRSCRRTRRLGRWRPLSPSSSVSARTLGSPDTWVPPPRYLGPWTPQSPPTPDAWVPPTQDTWVPGQLGVPPHPGHLGLWPSGSPPRRTPGSLDIWVPPTQDTWVPRQLGLSVVSPLPPPRHLGLWPSGSPPPQIPGSFLGHLGPPLPLGSPGSHGGGGGVGLPQA